MLLEKSVYKVFGQLTESLNALSDEEYARPCKALSGACVGQHVRHVVELFLCLEYGYDTGIINYEERKRDHIIETNKSFAIALMQDIYSRVDRPNIELRLQAGDNDDDGKVDIPTNYYREVAYNLEHAIHHMALIRIGINEISGVKLPEEFGVAYSTIKYRQGCAQ